MFILNKKVVYSFKCGLRPFKVLGIYYIFTIKLIILNKDILANDIGLK